MSEDPSFDIYLHERNTFSHYYIKGIHSKYIENVLTNAEEKGMDLSDFVIVSYIVYKLLHMTAFFKIEFF